MSAAYAVSAQMWSLQERARKNQHMWPKNWKDINEISNAKWKSEVIKYLKETETKELGFFFNFLFLSEGI